MPDAAYRVRFANGQVSLAGIAPGTYAVVCTVHPPMTATLEVT